MKNPDTFGASKSLGEWRKWRDPIPKAARRADHVRPPSLENAITFDGDKRATRTLRASREKITDCKGRSPPPSMPPSCCACEQLSETFVALVLPQARKRYSPPFVARLVKRSSSVQPIASSRMRVTTILLDPASVA